MDRIRRITSLWLVIHILVQVSFSALILPKTGSESGTLSNLSNNNHKQNWTNNNGNGNTFARLYPLDSTGFQMNPYYLQNYINPNQPLPSGYHHHSNRLFNNNYYLPPPPPNGYPGEKGLAFPLPIGQQQQQSPYLPHQNFPLLNNNLPQTGFQPALPPLNTKGFFPPILPPPPPSIGGHNQYLKPFDIGSFANQVRFPGVPNIQIYPDTQTLEITCEFPRYLILIQKIFWHFKYAYDPYGIYFDEQNVFSQRVRVRTIDNWKSILTIYPYTEDDFGIYRCLSSAILPAYQDSKSVLDLLSYGTKSTPNTIALASSLKPTLTSANLNDATSYDYESKQAQIFNNNDEDNKLVKKPRITRIMKFPNEKRSLRFTRQAIRNSISEENDLVSSSTDNISRYQFSDEVYDPFNQPRRPVTATTSADSHDLELEHKESSSQSQLHQKMYSTSSSRHLPFLNGLFNNFQQNLGGIYPSPPHHHHHHQHHQQQFPGVGGVGVGLNAPFYKPSYGIVTIYQEAVFPSPTANRIFANKFYRF